MTWDELFLEMATVVAKKSKDRSTKVGAVIVGPNHEVRSVGFNGFPRGVDEVGITVTGNQFDAKRIAEVNQRFERPAKYKWTEHSERNAIYNAARIGIPLDGCIIYLNRGIPCTDCARAVIQAGIKKVVTANLNFGSTNPQWTDDFKITEEMFNEAGVEIQEVKIDG